MERSVRFYEAFFGMPAHKRRPGYANFDVANPPLKLALEEDPSRAAIAGRLSHLGVQVATTDEVDATRDRLKITGVTMSTRAIRSAATRVRTKFGRPTRTATAGRCMFCSTICTTRNTTMTIGRRTDTTAKARFWANTRTAFRFPLRRVRAARVPQPARRAADSRARVWGNFPHPPNRIKETIMKVLYVCVHNAGRSQMAEAFTNHLARERGLPVTAESAGTEAGAQINPVAVAMMREIGISLDGHYPKMLTQEMADRADRIVTMGCGVEADKCPARIHLSEDWGLDDPKGQSADAVRAIRDQIRAKVAALLDEAAAVTDGVPLRPFLRHPRELARAGRVLSRIQSSEYDGVYCLAIWAVYAAFPNEVIARLQAENIPCVMGNYDENVGFGGDDCGCNYVGEFKIRMGNASFGWTCEHTTEANKAYLRGLPRAIRFEAAGRRVLLCHGSPRTINEYLYENAPAELLSRFLPGGADDAHADIIVCAHTHRPYHRVFEGVHFINTGTVGRPNRGETRANFCELTVDGDTVSANFVFVPYDVEAAASALFAAGLPYYFADYLRTGGLVAVPA